MSDWIPVNEKLPENNVHVLAQMKRGEKYYYNPRIMKYDQTREDWWDFTDVTWVKDACSDRAQLEVIAWMPLPDKYIPN